MLPQKFPGGFAPRPLCLTAPPTDLLLYTIFLQWFNILHKMSWDPGPIIFFIHLIFSIHIVSAPYNAHHSRNCFQRQFLQNLIKIKHYSYMYIHQEIRFPWQTAFWKKSKIWLCLSHSRCCNCKIFLEEHALYTYWCTLIIDNFAVWCTKILHSILEKGACGIRA